MSYFSSSSASLSDVSCLTTWEDNVCRDGSVFYAQYFRGNKDINCKKLLKYNKNINQNCKCKSDHLSCCIDSLHKRNGSNKKTVCEKLAGKEILVHLLINPENRNIGNDTVCESLLGFSTQPFSDGIRLMVSKFKMKKLLNQKKCVKTGDWFKSINEIEINSLNIDKILMEFAKSSTVYLKFERFVEDKADLPKSKMMQIATFGTLVNLVQDLYEYTNDKTTEVDSNFTTMIVPISFLCDESISNESIFCYPDKTINNIFNIRGCFLTLYSILKTQLAVEPIETKIHIGRTDYFVYYICHENVLLLLSISSNCLTSKEAQLKILDIVQYLQTCYQIFDKNIDSEMKVLLHETCKVIDIYLQNFKNNYLFEEILEQSHSIDLPKKTQQEIFETLNELGAMDYRDWNDTPLNAHREFFINGCALYYQSYLLNNQLLPTHLRKVESFLRCSGVFDFIKSQTVNDFIYWKEIPLENAQRRSFLLICTRNYLTLSVLLQEHENIIYEEKLRRPPLFYIEEIQETIDHLRHGGIEYLAKDWTKRFQRPNIDICETFISGEDSSVTASGSTPFVINSMSEDVSSMIRNSSFTNVMHFETSKNYESDSDWDGFSNSYKYGKRSHGCPALKSNFPKEISETSPISICIGEKNVLIYYIQINFGSGLIIAPPNELSSILVQEFKSACQVIHTVFENTKRLSKLYPETKTNIGSCRSLTLVREYAMLIYVPDNTGIKKQFWATGKLFMSPLSELYVCNKSPGPLNLEEIAFRMSFVSSG